MSAAARALPLSGPACPPGRGFRSLVLSSLLRGFRLLLSPVFCLLPALCLSLPTFPVGVTGLEPVTSAV